MLKGEMDVVFFSSKGKIIKKINVNEKKNFYIRFKKKIIHTVVPISKYCIYFETVLGPHKKTKNFLNFKLGKKRKKGIWFIGLAGVGKTFASNFIKKKKKKLKIALL